MRSETTAENIRKLMQFLGRHAHGPGRVYFAGGATAVLLGWRDVTLDVDLKLDPEPPGVFEALRLAKEEIGINIELAAPDDFMPAVPGWQERSQPVGTYGEVEFLHYDFYAQALAKIERGHTQDVRDVHTMLARKLIAVPQLRAYFNMIAPELARFPALDKDAFAEKLEDTLKRLAGTGND